MTATPRLFLIVSGWIVIFAGCQGDGIVGAPLESDITTLQADAAPLPWRNDAGLWPDSTVPVGGPSCGLNETVCADACCGTEEICQQGQCKPLGRACAPLSPCPPGFTCDDVLSRCVPVAKQCEYRPAKADFTPRVEWEWTASKTMPSHNQVMMAPMVANLTDDNKDGKIDRNDIPDIVFNTFRDGNYTTDGVLRVISGDGSGEHFSVIDPAHRTAPGTQVGLGDIDDDHKVEIVACASGGGTLAFEHDGTLKWRSPASCYAPALADLDGDGEVEVLVRGYVLAGKTGQTRWKASKGCGAYAVAADLDGDGKSEVICGNVAYTHDGQVFWWDTARPQGSPAIADLDGDGSPEIAVVSSGTHSLRAYRADGSLFWGPVDINQGHVDASDKHNGSGGGPLTIADFDGDGKPEIATAGGWGYVIFEHDGTPKWFRKTRDLSSRSTGSSVFDFEGDGRAEVVYADELKLRIYDGQKSEVLFAHCNTSGTLQEYPLVVDVDNDDHAEIVVANNNYAYKTCDDGTASNTGIRVISDSRNNWVRTRRIWNQHTYHVTNVDEDGRIPRVETPNWKEPTLNNFRQNVQTSGLFHAPDLKGKAGASSCNEKISASLQVENDGAAKVAAQTRVTLYLAGAASDTALATSRTQKALYPGQTETVTFELDTPAAHRGKSITLYAMLDDDGSGSASSGQHNECHEDNNRVELGTFACRVID